MATHECNILAKLTDEILSSPDEEKSGQNLLYLDLQEDPLRSGGHFSEF